MLNPVQMHLACTGFLLGIHLISSGRTKRLLTSAFQGVSEVKFFTRSGIGAVWSNMVYMTICSVPHSIGKKVA